MKTYQRNKNLSEPSMNPTTSLLGRRDHQWPLPAHVNGNSSAATHRLQMCHHLTFTYLFEYNPLMWYLHNSPCHLKQGRTFHLGRPYASKKKKIRQTQLTFQLYHLRAMGFSARSSTFSPTKSTAQYLSYTVFETIKWNNQTQRSSSALSRQLSPSRTQRRPLGAGKRSNKILGVLVVVTAVAVLVKIPHELIVGPLNANKY